MKKEVEITSVTEISANKTRPIGILDTVDLIGCRVCVVSTSEGFVLSDITNGKFFAVVKGYEVEGSLGSEIKNPWVTRRAGEFIEKALAEVAKAKRRKPKAAKAA
jgi:hypothetical protein